MKLSIIVPVYNDAENVVPFYIDLKKKVLDIIDYEYEIIMVNDGSKDSSYGEIKKIADMDSNIRAYSLSRNYGEWSAVLCGLSNCTGDCAVYKSVDLQEPSELILKMVDSWKKGNNVVLACRSDREEGFGQKLLAKLYYSIVRKIASSTMPENGYNAFLIDRKVIDVIPSLDIKNTAFVCELLSLGFKTERLYYVRCARKIGKSNWSVRMKIRFALDTMYSFSTLPVKLITAVGSISIIGSAIWGLYALYQKLTENIVPDGWEISIFFTTLAFGIIMVSIGCLCGYAWRTMELTRERPQYLIEERYIKEKLKK